MYYAMSIPEILVLLFILLLWVLSIVCFIKRYEKISTIERADMPSFSKKANNNDSTSSSTTTSNSNNGLTNDNQPNNDANMVLVGPIVASNSYHVAPGTEPLLVTASSAVGPGGSGLVGLGNQKTVNCSFEAGMPSDSFSRSNTSLFFRQSTPTPNANNNNYAAGKNIYVVDETEPETALRRSGAEVDGSRIALYRFQKNPNLQYLRQQQSANSFQSNLVNGHQTAASPHAIALSYTTNDMAGRASALDYAFATAQLQSTYNPQSRTSPYSNVLVNQYSVASSTSKENAMLGVKRLGGENAMLKSSSEPAFKELIECLSASTYLNNVEEEEPSTTLVRSASIDNGSNEAGGEHHEQLKSAANASLTDLPVKTMQLLSLQQELAPFHAKPGEYANFLSHHHHQHHHQPYPRVSSLANYPTSQLAAHQSPVYHPYGAAHHYHQHVQQHGGAHGGHHVGHRHQAAGKMGGGGGAGDSGALLDPQLIPKVIRKSLIDLHKRSVWNLSHKQALTYLNAKAASSASSSGGAGAGTITTTTTTTIRASPQPPPQQQHQPPPPSASASNMASASSYAPCYTSARVYTQPRHHNEAKIKVMENYV